MVFKFNGVKIQLGKLINADHRRCEETAEISLGQDYRIDRMNLKI
jgi:hypothetical protein